MIELDALSFLLVFWIVPLFITRKTPSGLSSTAPRSAR